MSVKASLLEHLWNENERLYPISLESSRDLKDVLDLFAIEMDEVSKVVQGFFDKYCGGVVDEDFLREFEKFYASISKRKMDEENILYGEYSKLNYLGIGNSENENIQARTKKFRFPPLECKCI